jgi:hypothetical protein
LALPKHIKRPSNTKNHTGSFHAQYENSTENLITSNFQ